MKCIINGKTYEGTPKACFDAMALAHKLDLEKAGLWTKEDEIKYRKRRG